MTRSIVSAELEDRHLRVLVVRGRGRRARVAHAASYTLDGEGMLAAPLAGALRAALAAAGSANAGAAALVLAVRSRQVVSGPVARPAPERRLPGHEGLPRVLASEARRLGVYAEAEELVIGYRQRASSGLDADLCVAPRAFVDELTGAAARAGFARVRVLASETVLANAADAEGGEAVARLDLHDDRALLVLARAGRTLAARRFKLPVPYVTDPDNGADVAPLLLAEIARSLAFFAEQGKGEPTRLIVSGAFAADSDLVRGLDLLPLPVVAALQPAPAGLDVATHGLTFLVPALALTLRLDVLPCLVEPERPSPGRVAAIALAQCAGVVGGWVGIDQLAHARAPAVRELANAIAQARSRSDDLAAEIDGLRDRLREPPAVRARAAILADLDRGAAARSALCAAIAIGRPHSLSLSKLDLGADGVLTLTGTAQTSDRLTALTALAELEGHLRTVPGLGHGRGALGETSDHQITFRFTARLTDKP